MKHICKGVTLTATEHALHFTRDDADFLTLPIAFRVGDVTYAPALSREENECITYTDGFATVTVKLLANLYV